MAYKFETIRKMLNTANAYKAKYQSVNITDIKPCISNGNTKIGRVLNVSLMPVMTCGNCKHCMGYCYDVKSCCRFPDTVIDARMRNTVLLHRDRDRYFNYIIDKCARRRKNKFFRWHVAGDIVDIDYLDRMCAIARMFPDFKFWTYTKMYDIVNEYVRTHGDDRAIAIPSNLSIMFSEWSGQDMPNPYNFPTFACRLKSEADKVMTGYHCTGNCDVCKKNNCGCVVGQSSWIDEH